MISPSQLTAEEFLALADQYPDKRFDFIDGELVEVSPKPLHGQIQAAITAALVTYTQQHPLGVVYTEVLHVLNSEKFIPDVCINHASRADYLTTPPLLAVEIRSDSQSRASQRRKAEAYIAQGTQMVLLVLPGDGVEVYRIGMEKQVLGQGDTIHGEPVLPGFRMAVSAILSP